MEAARQLLAPDIKFVDVTFKTDWVLFTLGVRMICFLILSLQDFDAKRLRVKRQTYWYKF